MNRSEFTSEVLHISVVAGMNQRFHQILEHRYRLRNRIVQIVVAALAVAALGISIYHPEHEDWVTALEVPVAILAVVAAIVLNVVPLGDWAIEHSDLFRRWSDLREDIDALIFDLPTGKPPTAPLVDRLKQLQGKLHRNCAAEPGLSASDERLFKACERKEKTSRPNIDVGCIPELELSPIATAAKSISGIFKRPDKSSAAPRT